MDQIEEKILKAFPLVEWSRRRVCLAASGGPDSVALVRAFVAIVKEAKLQNAVCVATVNHKLRDEESDEDAEFVRKLGTDLGIPVIVKTIDRVVLDRETKRLGSLESAARKIRYELLHDATKEFGARFLVTAHHADDQLETMLFRLFRGSGFDGLQGMATTRTFDQSLTLARPMLAITKKEILEYLVRLKQNYRVDSSNASPEFTRNRIRNELVPLLDEIFPNRWRGALSRLAEQGKETNVFLDERVDELEREVEKETSRLKKYRQALQELNVVEPEKHESSDVVDLPLQTLQNTPSIILKRYFMRLWRRLQWPLGELGSEEWDRLVAGVKQRKTPRQFPGNVAALFPDSDTARFQRITSSDEKR